MSLKIGNDSIMADKDSELERMMKLNEIKYLCINILISESCYYNLCKTGNKNVNTDANDFFGRGRL